MNCTLLARHVHPFILREDSEETEFYFSSNINKTLKSGTLIKNDKSTKITYVHQPFFDKPVIVKKFKFKGWTHSILRSIDKSRARNYWTSAQAIKNIGINTPSPLAMIEQKLGPIIFESYIITEFYTGQNAKKIIEQPNYYSRDFVENFVDNVVSIMSTMFQSNMTHGDTKVPNFMIKNNEVCIIDLDVVRTHKLGINFKKYIKQDIERFERDWVTHPLKEMVLSKTKYMHELFLDIK